MLDKSAFVDERILIIKMHGTKIRKLLRRVSGL